MKKFGVHILISTIGEFILYLQGNNPNKRPNFMDKHQELSTAQKISADRNRTNILKNSEQKTIRFLCERLPLWMTPDVLTAIGFLGSIMVFLGFWFGRTDSHFLLVSVVGFAIQWFGDSLDGRIAYYRDIPRKWYGFSLDMTMDWLSTILIGLGFFFYLPEDHRIYVYTFIVAYGWTMIIALLKYKVTDKYEIDTEAGFGPTELRIILCTLIGLEAFFPFILAYVSLLLNVILYVINGFDFIKLLKLANARDAEEKLAKK